MDADCPGEGRCHGCAAWCDDCGDVDGVCDAAECDRHRCGRCHVLLPADLDDRDWRSLCEGCGKSEKVENLERLMVDAASGRWADDGIAEIYARELAALVASGRT